MHCSAGTYCACAFSVPGTTCVLAFPEGALCEPDSGNCMCSSDTVDAGVVCDPWGKCELKQHSATLTALHCTQAGQGDIFIFEHQDAN